MSVSDDRELTADNSKTPKYSSADAISSISLGDAKKFLKLSLNPKTEPIGRFLTECEQSAQELSIEECLMQLPFIDEKDPPFFKKELSLQNWIKLKDKSKIYAREIPVSRHGHALVSYFTAVACALSYQKMNISSAKPAQIRSSLLDLAAAAKEPYRELYTQAIRQIDLVT